MTEVIFNVMTSKDQQAICLFHFNGDKFFLPIADKNGHFSPEKLVRTICNEYIRFNYEDVKWVHGITFKATKSEYNRIISGPTWYRFSTHNSFINLDGI